MKNGRLVLEGAPDNLIEKHFGSYQEIVVILVGPPSPADTGVLRSFGMKSTQSPLTWFGFMAPEKVDVLKMRAQFAANGLLIREIRVRAPDLNSLFLEVLGAPENGR